MQLNKEPELVAEISYFLGLVYRAINWYAMRNSKTTAFDIFEHRLEVASYNNSIPTVLKKLCNGLSLQAPSIPYSLIERLDSQIEKVLYMLRSWTQYFVYRASSVAKQLKEKKSYADIIAQIKKEIINPKK